MRIDAGWIAAGLATIIDAGSYIKCQWLKRWTGRDHVTRRCDLSRERIGRIVRHRGEGTGGAVTRIILLDGGTKIWNKNVLGPGRRRYARGAWLG